MTAVRFWGSTERGAPAISIKHVSVGGPHSAPETVYQHRRMENVGLKTSVNGRVGGLRFEQPICLWLADSSCTLARGTRMLYWMRMCGRHACNQKPRLYDRGLRGKAAVSVFPR